MVWKWVYLKQPNFNVSGVFLVYLPSVNYREDEKVSTIDNILNNISSAENCIFIDIYI